MSRVLSFLQRGRFLFYFSRIPNRGWREPEHLRTPSPAESLCPASIAHLLLRVCLTYSEASVLFAGVSLKLFFGVGGIGSTYVFGKRAHKLNDFGLCPCACTYFQITMRDLGWGA